MITRRNFIKAATAGGALAAFGEVSAARTAIHTAAQSETGLTGLETEFITEEGRQIPVIAETDLVVVGGTSAAVAAASAAAREGSRVFLAAPLPYLGDDICGTFRFVCEKDDKPDHPLSRRLFLQSKNPTPLYIKTELENELIDHDIPFLYSSYVTNVLKDAQGTPAGVVIINRSGRQAIRCKALIDATQLASVARLAGAPMKPFTAGKQRFRFVTVGSKSLDIAGATAEEVPYTLKYKNKTLPVVRYTFEMDVKDDSYATLQEIEQTIRDKTWTCDQSDSSDVLEFIPPVTIVPEREPAQPSALVRQIPLETLQPKGFKNMWVTGPAAGLPRETAEMILRPVHAIALGQAVGEKAAAEIKNIPSAKPSEVYNPHTRGDNRGQVRELLTPFRTNSRNETVTSATAALPVIGHYDVIVMGGGTAGAPAGISAARQGAKTLMMEYLHGLGGLTTLGLIGVYWDGYREGFSAEVDEGVHQMAPPEHPRQLKDWKSRHVSDWKQEFFRREYRKAGGHLWFGVLGCGALVKDNRIQGIIVGTPHGRGVVLGKVIIDSTGSADIAIAAGAEYEYTGKHVAVQGAGLGPWEPEDYYNNNDWAFIDDTDILDVSRIYVQAKKKNAGRYDIVKLPQTRERRRIVGEYSVTVCDVISKRRYPDTISHHKSSFDTHGMIVDPYFILNPPEKRHAIYDADVPLRALLPKGLTHILVTGLGAAADRDAMPVIRMQSCLQNQGYAVGYLAATAAKENKPPTKVDIQKIQKYLVGIRNLPEHVLRDKPFKAYRDQDFTLAATTAKDQGNGLEILLTDPTRCIRAVEKELLVTSTPAQQIALASILCILGNSTHASLLADEIRRHPTWDAGWHYTGLGQFGPCMSHLDALLIALGNSKDPQYLPVILEKARLLHPENTFSHYRAIALATGQIKHPDAIPVLYDLLTAPGMRYHHIQSYRDARRKTVPDTGDVSTRNAALKELHLARALYLCGDKDQLAQTLLKNYASGLQAHYARYALNALTS
jgi:2-polyprenyl-6-methoxyphenol hydroxylase-like FAD-dependent oxidoreductase